MLPILSKLSLGFQHEVVYFHVAADYSPMLHLIDPTPPAMPSPSINLRPGSQEGTCSPRRLSSAPRESFQLGWLHCLHCIVSIDLWFVDPGHGLDHTIE